MFCCTRKPLSNIMLCSRSYPECQVHPWFFDVAMRPAKFSSWSLNVGAIFVEPKSKIKRKYHANTHIIPYQSSGSSSQKWNLKCWKHELFALFQCSPSLAPKKIYVKTPTVQSSFEGPDKCCIITFILSCCWQSTAQTVFQQKWCRNKWWNFGIWMDKHLLNFGSDGMCMTREIAMCSSDRSSHWSKRSTSDVAKAYERTGCCWKWEPGNESFQYPYLSLSLSLSLYIYIYIYLRQITIIP